MRKSGIHGIVLTVFLSACAYVEVDLGPNHNSSHPSANTSSPNSSNEGTCKLVNLGYPRQETGSWCWAASTQMVINYVNPIRFPNQCELVTQALGLGLAATPASDGSLQQIDCCDAKDDNLGSPSSGPARERCIVGLWPHTVFSTDGINIPYDMIYLADMNWDVVTGQICADRPFIFVVQWVEGGRHSAVVGGYQSTVDGDRFVEVYDHYKNDFFVMPYNEFFGVPRDFTHELDYINIAQQ